MTLQQPLLLFGHPSEGSSGSGIQASSPTELSPLWWLSRTDRPGSHPVTLEGC